MDPVYLRASSWGTINYYNFCLSLNEFIFYVYYFVVHKKMNNNPTLRIHLKYVTFLTLGFIVSFLELIFYCCLIT